MGDGRSLLVTQGGRWLPPIALAGAALFVFGGSLQYFFAQDDFFALARAAGILPRLDEPWRYLSAQAYFDLMQILVGTNAAAYHWVSLAGHAACTVLLYRLLQREFAPWSVYLACTFFAVHPMLFTLLYSISAIADIFALFLALLALEIGRRRDVWRWMAAPVYASALLCKESVLLLPAVLLLFLAWDRRPRTEIKGTAGKVWRHELAKSAGDPLVWVLVVLGAAYAAYFLASKPMAYALAGSGAEAYALGIGPHLWGNALTYLGWTLYFLYPTVQGFTDAVDPRVFPYGVLALAIWLVGAFVPALRTRGWVLGGALYVLLLLPVLPLANHTYHYYLYGALVGTAWCVAAASEAGLRAAKGRRRAGAMVTGVVLFGLVANAFAVVRRIETQPFAHPELLAEPVVDRARIAGNVRDGLAAVEWPAGATVLFWSPEARSLSASGNPDGRASERETYWEINVRTAVADGLAAHLLFPNIEAVEFVLDFGPVGDSLYYAVYRVTGELDVMPSRALEALLQKPPPGS